MARIQISSRRKLPGNDSRKPLGAPVRKGAADVRVHGPQPVYGRGRSLSQRAHGRQHACQPCAWANQRFGVDHLGVAPCAEIQILNSASCQSYMSRHSISASDRAAKKMNQRKPTKAVLSGLGSSYFTSRRCLDSSQAAGSDCLWLEKHTYKSLQGKETARHQQKRQIPS